MKSRFSRAFTLIELLVVIAIIAILAAIVLANMSSASKRGRDAERQSDIRNLQIAIEAYKHKKGQYPDAGCDVGGGNWATESACPVYIKDLSPEFIARLPRDPARGNNEGYSYVTNSAGSVYKIMAMNTVEADTIDYTHPFASCDIRYGDSKEAPTGAPEGKINLYGWCSALRNSDNEADFPERCFKSADGGDTRFDISYGRWGGFADNGNGNTVAVKSTTNIICQ